MIQIIMNMIQRASSVVSSPVKIADTSKNINSDNSPNYFLMYETKEYKDDINIVVYRRISYMEMFKIRMGVLSLEDILPQCFISVSKLGKIYKKDSREFIETVSNLLKADRIDIAFMVDQPVKKQNDTNQLKYSDIGILQYDDLYNLALFDKNKYTLNYAGYIKVLRHIPKEFLDYLPFSAVNKIVNSIEAENMQRLMGLQYLGISRSFGVDESKLKGLVDQLCGDTVPIDDDSISDLETSNPEMYKTLMELSENMLPQQQMMFRKTITKKDI